MAGPRARHALRSNGQRNRIMLEFGWEKHASNCTFILYTVQTDAYKQAVNHSCMLTLSAKG